VHDLLKQARLFAFKLLDLFLSQRFEIIIGAAVGQYLFRLPYIGRQFLVLAVFRDDCFELALLFGQGHELGGVAGNIRLGNLLFYLAVARLDLVEFRRQIVLLFRHKHNPLSI